MATTRRRINSTDRKRILREHVDIRLVPVEIGDPIMATVDIKHNELSFPADSEIVLEAYQKANSMRFLFGTIDSPRDPSPLVLKDLDPSIPVLFRLKVVDRSIHLGRILGSAEKIRPLGSDDESEGRRPLLPVVTQSMGEEMWKIEISPAGPELILNLKIPSFKQKLVQNAMLRGVILPIALRIVLEELINNPVTHDDEGSWEADWIRFCADSLNLDDPSDLSDDERETWVSYAVRCFCDQHEFVTYGLRQLEEGR